MRILLVTHFFPPSHTAGAENYAYGLARSLLDAGHEAAVICAGDWDRGPAYFNGFHDDIYEGIPVRRLNFNWTLAPDPNSGLYDNPIAGDQVASFVQSFDPDVVHIISCYTLTTAAAQAVAAAGVPLVLTLVDFWFLCPTLHLRRSDGELCDGDTSAWDCLRCLLYGQKAYRWPASVLPESRTEQLLTRLSQHPAISRQPGLRGMALDMAGRKRATAACLHLPDIVIAPSQFLADVHRRIHPDLPIRVRYLGHDLEWVNALPPAPGARAGPLRFACLSQVAPDKGVDVALRAFRQLDQRREATLDVWGGIPDDPYGQLIRNLSEPDDGIRLRGRFPRQELGRVLGAADVVVVPSLWYENNPLVMQEAFAAGRPVIASDLGGMREFVTHEQDGLLFTAGDSDDLARQMQRLINDRALLELLSANVPVVKSMAEEVGELLELYAGLLPEAEYVVTHAG